MAEDSQNLKIQREQALACMILSAAVSFAVLLSVFGPQKEIEIARRGVLLHRPLLEEAQKDLAVNQATLREVQAALEKLRNK